MPVIKSSSSPQTPSPKILEFQKKIQDESYISSAIDRIALIVSRQIVEKHSITGHSVEKTY